ncbi:MAG: DNA polymerase III subunit delta [Candidatus Buchananbacteria bacterium]|jgi:DNA polymerase-3 subunit delta
MIYYIYGTDNYLCSAKAEEIKKGFTEKRDKAGLNIIRFKADDLNYDQFAQEAMTVPFLSEKKLLVIEGLCEESPAGRKKLREDITEFLKSHEEIDNNLLFIDVFKDEKNLPAKDALFVYLTKQKYSWYLPALKNSNLSSWLKKYCAANKINISPAAISELILLVGNDLVQMTNELKKLVSYKNGETIEPEDVRLLVKAKYDDDVFGLTDALANKNRKQAMELLSQQFLAGNEPLSLLGSINWQFKSLLKIKSVLEADPRATPAAIASQTGVHSFVVSKNLSAVKKFTLAELIEILNSLLDIEKKLKSGGSKNPELIFDMFIAKFC